MDLKRNMLAQSSSRYLRQHAGHPVWWQEWTPEVLNAAAISGKMIFVSVGYSSCHWCHVMADESFSDPYIAGLLNGSCISIKVDREQRPDIDQYLMDFLLATTGSGGWPLNVFMSPDMKPFFAFTYTPPYSTRTRRGLAEMLPRIFAFHRDNSDQLAHFSISWSQDENEVETQSDPLATIASQFDAMHGGFGEGAKFPPYSTLLFLFYRYCYSPTPAVAGIINTTLQSMAMRGLHDHVRGGFFRYCVDREWNIPHFEKLLIDQAMQLWVYSIAEHIFPNRGYRAVALGIVRCLERDFRIGDCYGASIDADINGIEGAGALWSPDELADSLNQEQRRILNDAYSFIDPMLHNDRYHIIQNPVGTQEPATAQLYTAIPSAAAVLRAHLHSCITRRPQPELDRTILTDANCLAGVALANAARSLQLPFLRHRAVEIFFTIDRKLRTNGFLYHSISSGNRSTQRYARDAAVFTLLADTLYEYSFAMQPHYDAAFRMLSLFNTGGSRWVESVNPDFFPIPAASFDNPYPSTLGLIELVYTRQAIRSNRTRIETGFLPGLQQDFANIARIIQQGHFFTIYTNHEIHADQVPVNAIVLPGSSPQYCYEGECHTGPLSAH